MLMSYIPRIVNRVCEAFIFELNGSRDAAVRGRCADFVSDVMNNMQPVYRFALALLFVWFDLGAFVKSGRFFSRMPLEARNKCMAQWSKSRLSVKRDFIAFLLNLTVIAYYDSTPVLQKENIDVVAYRKMVSFFIGGE